MPGSAAAGQPGNGGRDWPALAEQAEEHSAKVYQLALGVGPDHDPSQDLVDRLLNASDFLWEVLVLVDEVRHHIDQATATERELAGLLHTLSDSVQTARDAIQDYADTLHHELAQRAAEEEHVQYRSNKRFREDRQELRELSRSAVKALEKLGGHLNGLLRRLRRR
jgi:hypothetical protein